MDTSSEEKRKRYYWLKLHEGFFDDPIIKKLRKIAGGDTYTCIYLKMMLLSVKTNGILIYEGLEDSFEKELALKLDEEETNVKIVVNYLFSYHLMTEESKKNRSFLMPAVLKMTGSEGSSAQRVRDHRDRKKNNSLPNALQCNDKSGQNTPILLHCNLEVTDEKNPMLQCNNGVTQHENPTLLHCNGSVTECNNQVTSCNIDETQCNANFENFDNSVNAHQIDAQAEKALHCNSSVTTCNESVTTENKRTEIDICSSSFKDTTTTTTYINSDLQKWLSHKSQGKNNPQGYEYTLLKKINDNEESVIREYHAWLENKATQVKSNELSSFKGKVLPTQDGDKVILGIELFEEKYRIYFEEGGFAIVQTLVNLPISERN